MQRVVNVEDAAGPAGVAVAHARSLRDAGHEVIHLVAPTPEQVVAIAVQEDAHRIDLPGMSEGVAARVRALLVAAGAADIEVRIKT